ARAGAPGFRGDRGAGRAQPVCPPGPRRGGLAGGARGLRRVRAAEFRPGGACMNRAGGSEAGDNPFSPRAALALVLFGAAVFVALLWMIGAGLATGSTNDGGSHAGGKGLTGYAGLAALLE